MTPAAVIPMHTPDEAIAELEHVVGTLGLKVIAVGADGAVYIAADGDGSVLTLRRT